MLNMTFALRSRAGTRSPRRRFESARVQRKELFSIASPPFPVRPIFSSLLQIPLEVLRVAVGRNELVKNKRIGSANRRPSLSRVAHSSPIGLTSVAAAAAAVAAKTIATSFVSQQREGSAQPLTHVAPSRLCHNLGWRLGLPHLRQSAI